MTVLLLLLVSSVLSLTKTTTLVASIYIPDIEDPMLELNPTTIKLKLEFMQIKDPRTKSEYKDSPPVLCYWMLRAIHGQKEDT